MNDEERFQQIKEKEIKRLTTPLTQPGALGKLVFQAPRDCEGNPVQPTFGMGGKKFILEPKPGILSDYEILMYAPESKEASKIRLKRGEGDKSDKSRIHSNMYLIGVLIVVFLFNLGLIALISNNLNIRILFFLILFISVGFYIYIMYIKDYTESRFKQDLKVEKPVEDQKTSNNDDLLSLFESKEKIAREMIEKKFPAPQMTNTKFNAVLNNCKEVVESQVEILNTLIPTEKTKYEIDYRKKLIKQIIGKIDDLTNELILSEESNLEDVVEDMDELIDSVKDY